MIKPILAAMVLAALAPEVRAQRVATPLSPERDQLEKLEITVRDAILRAVFRSGTSDIAASSNSSEKTVRIIYLIPSDREENPAYKQALGDAIRHLQVWYGDQLASGTTFRLHDPVVEIYETSHEASWYSTNPSGDLSVQFWNNVLADAFPLTGGMFDDPDNRWIYYIDALATCGQISGGGTNGVVVIHANDLLGLVGMPEIPLCPDDNYSFPPCRYVGGLGHELGHGFGLPHPPGCDEGEQSCDSLALMWQGYVTYPDTYLRVDEKRLLSSTPFFDSIDMTSAPRECSEIGFPFAPNVLGPSDGATGVELPVTLRWNAEPASETYRIEVSTDMAFQQPLGSHSGVAEVAFDTAGVADTTIVVPGLAYGTTYYWHVQGENDAGIGSFSSTSSFSTTSGVATEPTGAIAASRLNANYPNPFRGSTTIGYALGQPSHVSLTVYDAYGRLVRRLVDGLRGPGPNEVVFDAAGLADGIYFIRLDTEGFGAVRRVTVLR